MVIAMLALLSSRSACAPLNPALDESAARAFLTAMRVDALIAPADASSPLRRTAKALGLRILEIVEPRDAATSCFANVDTRETPSRIERAEPDDLALLMATSGTTGPPSSSPPRS